MLRSLVGSEMCIRDRLYTGIRPNHVAVISTGTPVMNPYTLHANASCSSTNTGNIMYITKFWNVGLAFVVPSSLCIELEDCLRRIVSTMTPTPKSATPIQESIPPAITPASVTRISDGASKYLMFANIVDIIASFVRILSN